MVNFFFFGQDGTTGILLMVFLGALILGIFGAAFYGFYRLGQYRIEKQYKVDEERCLSDNDDDQEDGEIRRASRRRHGDDDFDAPMNYRQEIATPANTAFNRAHIANLFSKHRSNQDPEAPYEKHPTPRIPDRFVLYPDVQPSTSEMKDVPTIRYPSHGNDPVNVAKSEVYFDGAMSPELPKLNWPPSDTRASFRLTPSRSDYLTVDETSRGATNTTPSLHSAGSSQSISVNAGIGSQGDKMAEMKENERLLSRYLDNGEEARRRRSPVSEQVTLAKVVKPMSTDA